MFPCVFGLWMKVDEELLDGPDHKTIYDQEPDLSDSRNSATTVNSNASNTTIVMRFNRSFPADNADTVSESIRFPLQDAKDSNIPNIMQRDAPSIESVKANLLNTPAYVGFLLPDKENLIAEACESMSNSFPTAIEKQSDGFPLDVIEFAPVQIPVHHSSAPQEKFVPANECKCVFMFIYLFIYLNQSYRALCLFILSLYCVLYLFCKVAPKIHNQYLLPPVYTCQSPPVKIIWSCGYDGLDGWGFHHLRVSNPRKSRTV